MTEKYTTQMQYMSDLRTGYFHGCVILYGSVMTD